MPAPTSTAGVRDDAEAVISRVSPTGPMPRIYPFVWLDVFATRPLEGNQLAVFPDARGLSDNEMLEIARETHLSETTFVFPEGDATDRARGFRTRIFAVQGEMPFAGHPTLGTAAVLAARRGWPEVALALKVGRIPVTFSDREGRRFGEMAQNDPVIGQSHDSAQVARALGATVDDLDLTHPIQTVSTGVPFAVVPFRSLRALSSLHPVWSRMEEYLRATDASFFYLISRETVDPSASLHARMIFSGGEDPATGSAVGPAVAWSVLHGRVRADETIVVEQGVEVHRVSRMFVRAGLEGGKPVRVRVGGFCAPVIEGQLML